MRSIFTAFIFVSIFASGAAAQKKQPQDLTREQKIQELGALGGTAEKLQKRLEEIETRRGDLEEEILNVTDADVAEASKEDASAFRIFPRGLLDDKISLRGGAAYYSFTKQSSDYDDAPQIQLENDNLSVGFYGANFGFISDLRDADFSVIDEKTKGVAFLIDYRPPTKESEAREEYRKAQRGFEVGGVGYQKQVAAVVGHAYVLRAVSFGEADALVAFKIYRRDADGSLIIFWKKIAFFEAPELEKNKIAANDSQTVETIDNETANAVRDALVRAGLFNVSVEATNQTVTLRGIVPKRKMADAVRMAQEIGKRKVANELTEQ